MDFLNNLKGTINSVSKDVVNKVSSSTSIAKLHSKIKENEQKSLQVKTELGSAVYEAWDKLENSPFAEFLMKLKELEEEKLTYQKEIEQIQEEMARQQAEMISTEKAIRCPVCGKMNEEGARFCMYCGNQFEVSHKGSDNNVAQQKICHNCGNIIGEGELFCIKCGAKISD